MECKEQAFAFPLLELATAALLEVRLNGPGTDDAGSFVSMECMEEAFALLAIDLAGTMHS